MIDADADIASLFARHASNVAMPSGLRRRIWWRVRVELWKMRVYGWLGRQV